VRKAERQLKERDGIDSIIRRCRVCRMGMVDGGQPYIVPFCFGYDGQSVFLHMAPEGKKIDCLRKNAGACIEFDIPGEIIESKTACGFSILYESVIAFGVAEFLESAEDKRYGLMQIMRQYSEPDEKWSFPENILDKTVVVKVFLTEVTGKAKTK
jgi:uncharacterized protein